MYTRIKQVLDYSGLNQQEFADRIAVAPATLSNILKGKVAKYNTDLLLSIRAAFPVIDFEWLLTGEGEMLKRTTAEDGDQNPEKVGSSNPSENGFSGSAPDQDSSSLYNKDVDGGANGLFGQDGDAFAGSYANGGGYPGAPAYRGGQMYASGSNNPQDAHGQLSRESSADPRSARTGNRSGAYANSGTPGRRTGNTQTANSSMGGYGQGYPSQNLQNMAMKIIDRNARSIKEIRVYFDDDTFEVFVPSK